MISSVVIDIDGRHRTQTENPEIESPKGDGNDLIDIKRDASAREQSGGEDFRKREMEPNIVWSGLVPDGHSQAQSRKKRMDSFSTQLELH